MQRALWAAAALAMACGSAAPADEVPVAASSVAPADSEPGDEGAGVPASPQRPGDPAAGLARLLGEGYVGCGVPRRLYQRFAGQTADWLKVPGRTGAGADLPYFLNSYRDDAGVELVTANCLGCHASYIGGELVIGLGDAGGDFTMDVSTPMKMAGLLVRSLDERRAWNKLADRVDAIAPYIRTRTVGANPADVIAAVLFAHRDPDTLAWSDQPLIDLPAAEPPIPVDVPAWWLMKKKTAMFWTGAGRGDHARIMMTASVLCVDDLASARAIDAYFPDVRAYIASLAPPAYPEPLEAALVDAGRELFEITCSGCHGSYGEEPRYPNRVVPIDEIGTDPALHRGSGQYAGRYRDWFNRSFYGEMSRLVATAGYVAPPLDGVWATAPYLHNGSVPTLAAMLDSSRRPTRWQRLRGTRAYDLQAVGWRTAPVTDDTPATHIYDTSWRGYGNRGHTFADDLTPNERRALLEYLKSL